MVQAGPVGNPAICGIMPARRQEHALVLSLPYVVARKPALQHDGYNHHQDPAGLDYKEPTSSTLSVLCQYIQAFSSLFTLLLPLLSAPYYDMRLEWLVGGRRGGTIRHRGVWLRECRLGLSPEGGR